MTRTIKLYLIAFVAFLAIDGVWLTFVAQGVYKQYLGYLMSPTPNLLAAGIFYLLFIVGLLVFVILPGLKEGSLGNTLLRGALFGLVSYATYDLTNLATVKDWPIAITVIDLIWGTVLSAAVSFVTFTLGRRIR
ncbi:MAG TPA: DUF2177 family protein [Thermoflexales bacterium]|nr:DUF2177 family protein [Thermoflexales bacterium]HQW35795.1 DUF2177 family protein [Thermoflexales bacterium]HQZ22250.1 DUF2177 family protein [Thermoflexales bacterium]HQZ99754.1 DUF2177 family protein [Thermoflexales bacterium]